MKGAVEELVQRLHAGKLEFIAANHPAFAAALDIKINGRVVGVLGVVSAKLRHPFRLTTQMALAEISLDVLLKRTDATGKVSPVAQFPSVKRDIAVTVGEGVSNAAIVDVIRRNGGKELVRIDLFDVFKNSRAYSLEFLSAEKTLTDEEVGRSFKRVVDALKAMEGVDVREG
jgi:phenylalanyl-tRNA synthetase beta chain